jgi:hypothetical protein
VWRKKYVQKNQAPILKYDTDNDDIIQKFKDPKTDKYFSYGSDAGRRIFNDIAKGKQPGEIVEIPVHFKKGGPKVIHAVVSVDGTKFETAQALNISKNKFYKMTRDKDFSNYRSGDKKITTHSFRLPLDIYKYEVITETEKSGHDVLSITRKDKQPIETVGDLHDMEVLEAMEKEQNILSGDNIDAIDVDLTTGVVRHTPLQIPQSLVAMYNCPMTTEEMAEVKEAIKKPRTDLKEVRQAFKNITHGKHVYAVYELGQKFMCDVTLVPYQEAGKRVGTAMIYPKHYREMVPMVNGKTYQLSNCQRAETCQWFVWHWDDVVAEIPGQDLLVHRLPKNYAHLSCANQLEVLPDGIHNLWFTGVDPSGHPFMTYLENCVKKGVHITYKANNKAGICAGTLLKDTDQNVVVGFHVSGNEKYKNCTAEAVTPKLRSVLGVDSITDRAF